MATMTVLGSSSSGNGYILDANGEVLAIELGCRWEDYLQNLQFDISSVVAAVVSHVHGDHLDKRTASKVLTFGIPLYSCQEVADKYKGVLPLKKGEKMKLGRYTVQPIPLTHNCECVGFLIEHPAFGRLVFASDTNSFPYRFREVNHIFLEVNHDEETMIDRMCAGHKISSHPENHLSLEQAKDAINRNKSLSLQTICCIHLSDGNANEKRILDAMKEIMPTANVVCADKGMVIELNKEEF